MASIIAAGTLAGRVGGAGTDDEEDEDEEDEEEEDEPAVESDPVALGTMVRPVERPSD
jgi:hypothetical protein